MPLVAETGTSNGLRMAANVYPEVGSIDASANYTELWTNKNYGVTRSGDRKMLITSTPDFGVRGTTRNSFDADTFGFSVDLTDTVANHALTVTLSPTQCDYFYPFGTGKINLDVVKDPSDETSFLVTLANGTIDHNKSITGFGDGVWPTDGAYSGAVVKATDCIVNVNFANDGTNTVVTVNEKSYTVASSLLYTSFSTPDHAGQYAMFGMMNGTSSAHEHFIVNSVGDDAEDTYYSATGKFGTGKAVIEDLETKIAAGLTTVETLNAAKDTWAAFVKGDLHDFDQTYFSARISAIETALHDATVTLGAEAVIQDYEKNLEQLIALDEGIGTGDLAKVDACMAKKDMVLEKQKLAKDETMAATFTEAQAARVTAADAKFVTEQGKIGTRAGYFYEASVNAYSDKVAAIKTIEDVNEATKLRAGIVGKYSYYFGEEALTAINSKITAADEKLATVGHATPDGWAAGSSSYTIKDGDKMGVSLAGSSIGEAVADTAGIFYEKEKLSVSDFSLTINKKQWSKKTTSWFSFGLMEKPEMFSAADDISVQDNKGVFFLLTYGDGQIKAELYLMSLTCNRFFDAVQSSTIRIPENVDELKISFAEVDKEISGVSDTYWIPTFNGAAMDGNNIKAKKLKTCLGTEKTGYLYMASQDTDANNSYTFDITDINGHKPYDASLVKAIGPTSDKLTPSYVIGGGDLVLNYTSNGNAITKVTLDGTEIASTNYVLDDAAKTLTIKASALANVKVGTSTIVVESAGGNLTYTLAVTSGGTTSSSTPGSTSQGGGTSGGSSEGGKSGGCGGAIAGTALVSGLALVGVTLLASKRKHDKK